MSKRKILILILLLSHSFLAFAEPNLRNQQIFQETLDYIQRESLPLLEVLSFEGSPSNDLPPSLLPSVSVWNKSSFQAAQELAKTGHKPLILDMANKLSPGGSVLKGSAAQEETLCRQSNLYSGLMDAAKAGLYPIIEQGGVLVKNVTFFRNDSYEFLENSFQADVFASAAYDCNPKHSPYLEENLAGYDRPESDIDYELGTKAKMRAFFRAAVENDNDALVLSAFGCGAFKNDPKVISKWYKEVLGEAEFQDAFQLIVFAILEEVNFSTFYSCFSKVYEIANTPIDAQGNKLVCFYKTGPTEFLGNFFICPQGLHIWEHGFRCSEAAFQWKKYELAGVTDPKMEKFFQADGVQAFSLNRYFERKYPEKFAQGWKSGVRDQVMWEILEAKFQQNPEIMQWLMETSGAYLLEHNEASRDNYWSDNHDGSGKNMLGKMLMAIRDQLPKPLVDDSSDAELVLYFAEFANQPGALSYQIY